MIMMWSTSGVGKTALALLLGAAAGLFLMSPAAGQTIFGSTTAVVSDPSGGAAGRFGNAGNDIIETPPLRNLDLALRKEFRFTECFGYPAANSSAPGTVGVITSALRLQF